LERLVRRQRAGAIDTRGTPPPSHGRGATTGTDADGEDVALVSPGRPIWCSLNEKTATAAGAARQAPGSGVGIHARPGPPRMREHCTPMRMNRIHAIAMRN
jgi:hypothetical protein